MTDIDTPQTAKQLPPGTVVGAGDLVEAAGHPVGGGLIKPGYDPRLTNEDLAPLKKQTWSSYNIFAFWMSDVHSVGGYVTAGSLFALGLASWQVEHHRTVADQREGNARIRNRMETELLLKPPPLTTLEAKEA